MSTHQNEFQEYEAKMKENAISNTTLTTTPSAKRKLFEIVDRNSPKSPFFDNFGVKPKYKPSSQIQNDR